MRPKFEANDLNFLWMNDGLYLFLIHIASYLLLNSVAQVGNECTSFNKVSLSEGKVMEVIIQINQCLLATESADSVVQWIVEVIVIH